MELSVRAVQAARVRDLSAIPRGPVGRLLVTQALSEPLRLVTSDRHIF